MQNEITFEDKYKEILDEFLENKNKDTLISILNSYCNECIHAKTFDNIFNLKNKMMTEFAKDVSCSYISSHSNDYGCDLREIMFNMDDSMQTNTDDLIKTFYKAYIENSNRKKLHILTDMDDTLYPNRGVYTGSDISWDKKKTFPGVIEFYKHLHEKPFSSKYSSILSATPGFLKSKKFNDSHLREILGNNFGFLQGSDEKIQAIESGIQQLTGSLVNWWSNSSNIQSNYVKYGNKKFKRFIQMKLIFPEFTFIFIGDNGQGDLLTAIRMLEHDNECIACIRMVCNYCDYCSQAEQYHSSDKFYPGNCVCDVDNTDNFKGKFFKPIKIPPEVKTYDLIKKRLFGFRNYYELSLIFKGLNIFTKDDVGMIKTNLNIELSSKPEPIKSLYESTGKSIYGPKKLDTRPIFSFITDDSIHLVTPNHGGVIIRKSKKKSRKNTSKRNIHRYNSSIYY